MYLLLTERPTALRRHAGQVSLPGGAVEALDGSLWQTALRETREELGIRTGRLRPLGRLDTITISASNYLVTPFVAWNPVAPALRPDPREVARVIEMPLRALLDPSTVVEERWELRGSEWYVTCYRFDSVLVWGATARILHDFTVRIHGNPDPNRPPPGSVRPV